MNANDITMCIDGKDIEMKYPICYGKIYEGWLVSKCGKIWSLKYNKLLTGTKLYNYSKNSKAIKVIDYQVVTEKDWWGDGSGYKNAFKSYQRHISAHKMVMDTWAPLYDNPPKGIVWEEWEKVRDLPTVYNHISKTVVIDHIDDDPTNNHIDNLRRVTQWDNHHIRKKKGI
jgi:hypothetical protein